MSKHDQPAGDRNERLSQEIYRELGRIGWRMPKSEPEVRAAEEWVSKTPDRLPERLGTLPESNRAPERSSFLDRYLNTDRVDHSRDDQKDKDADRSDRDLDR
jgi:hypothetical protein